MDFLQIVSSIMTIALSVMAIVLSLKLSKETQKITLLAQKRSVRIDALRQYSARIISAAESVNCEIRIPENKEELIKNVALFNGQLQYIYPYDIELIDLAISIKKLVLSGAQNDSLLSDTLLLFWKKVDLYVGTEYERLKKESTGEIESMGAVEDSQELFTSLYEKLETASTQNKEIMHN